MLALFQEVFTISYTKTWRTGCFSGASTSLDVVYITEGIPRYFANSRSKGMGILQIIITSLGENRQKFGKK